MDINLVNLTPHDINLIIDRDTTITIKPDEVPLRLKSQTKRLGDIKTDGDVVIPLSHTKYNTTTALPERVEGTNYIVSAMIAQAYPKRDDFLIVNETVRNEEGQVIGARSLARITEQSQLQEITKSDASTTENPEIKTGIDEYKELLEQMGNKDYESLIKAIVSYETGVSDKEVLNEVYNDYMENDNQTLLSNEFEKSLNKAFEKDSSNIVNITNERSRSI